MTLVFNNNHHGILLRPSKLNFSDSVRELGRSNFSRIWRITALSFTALSSTLFARRRKNGLSFSENLSPLSWRSFLSKNFKRRRGNPLAETVLLFRFVLNYSGTGNTNEFWYDRFFEWARELALTAVLPPCFVWIWSIFISVPLKI